MLSHHYLQQIVLTVDILFLLQFYDIPSDVSGNISPSVTLEPPHMDGVEAIAISKRQKVLFTGSRDKSIKKWDLETKKSIKVKSLKKLIEHGSNYINYFDHQLTQTAKSDTPLMNAGLLYMEKTLC